MNKKKAQNSHARHRAFERYGILLSRGDLGHLAYLCQTNRGKFIKKDTSRISIWEVEFDETIIWVAYDKIRKSIASVLPRGEPGVLEKDEAEARPVGELVVDEEAQAAYVKLNHGLVANTFAGVAGVNLDVDDKGNLIGIEFESWPPREHLCPKSGIP